MLRWPWRRKKKEEQDWKMMTAQFGHGDGRRKKSKTGEDGSYQTAQVGHGEGRRKSSKTGEDGSYHTARVGPGDRGRKKRKKCIGYDLDLLWIEIGVLKNSRNELTRPVMGTIFLVYICRYVCLPYVKMHRRNYVAQTRTCSRSVLGG